MPIDQQEDLRFGNLPLRSRIRRSSVFRYLLAVCLACLAAVLQSAVQLLLGPAEDIGGYQFFLGAVALSAIWTGRRSALVTLCCAGILKLYFFLPPFYSFRLESPATLVRLVLFLAI